MSAKISKSGLIREFHVANVKYRMRNGPLKGTISLSLASQPTHKFEGTTRRNCEEILQNPKLLDFRYCDGGGDTGENFVRFVFTNERYDFALSGGEVRAHIFLDRINLEN